MTDIMVELRAANPAPAEADLHPTAWSDAALLAEIDTRSGTDMSLDQKPHTERAKAAQSPRRWNRGLVAATAFAAVVAVVGVVAVLGGGSPSTTTTPPATSTQTDGSTTTEPPLATTQAPVIEDTMLTPDQVTFVESYLAAWNSDADSFLAMFAPDAVAAARGGISGRSDDNLGEYEWDVFVARTRWQVAVGTQATADINRCADRSGVIVCPFSYTDPYFQQTLVDIDGVLHLHVESGEIVRQEIYWGNAVAGDVSRAVAPFGEWLVDNYPASAPLMIGNTIPVFTPESAELWLRLLPRYFGEDAPLDAEETAFVTSFFDAWNSDIDEFLGFFAAGVDLERWVQQDWQLFVDVARFNFAIDRQYAVDPGQCLFRDGQIVCPFTYTTLFVEPVHVRLPGVVRFAVEDGLVTRLEGERELSDRLDDFQVWLYQNHPDVGRRMILDSTEPIFTEESAKLWRQYVPLWLEEIGLG